MKERQQKQQPTAIQRRVGGPWVAAVSIRASYLCYHTHRNYYAYKTNIYPGYETGYLCPRYEQTAELIT